MPHTEQHKRKQQAKRKLGGGEARQAAEDISTRRMAIDSAVESAVEGKDPTKAKNKEVRKGRERVPTEQQRKRRKNRGQTVEPSVIQQILDAVLGR